MSEAHGTLGICVETTRQMDHLLGIAKAAHAAGKEVKVFFTGEGVRLTQDPRITELMGVAKVTLCEVSYHANGFKGVEIPGLNFKAYATQGKNAEMLDECERYIVL